MDVNTLLVTILLGLSVWTLSTVHGLAKRDAARAEHDDWQDAEIEEVKTRLSSCEEGLGEVRITVAEMHIRQNKGVKHFGEDSA